MKIIPLWVYALTGLLVLILLTFPLFYYGHQFSGGRSNKSEDWEAFGSFWGAFVAMANLVMFTFLSVLVYRYTTKRDEENASFQEGQARPVLIFYCDDVTGKWKVENVGNGPALKVLIRESNEEVWVGSIVKLYTLAKERTVELSWLKDASMICAVYDDVYGNRYLSIGADDETRTAKVTAKLSEQQGPFVFNQGTVEEWFRSEAITVSEAINLPPTQSSTTTRRTTTPQRGSDGLG